jgi:hypothetical protein
LGRVLRISLRRKFEVDDSGFNASDVASKAVMQDDVLQDEWMNTGKNNLQEMKC